MKRASTTPKGRKPPAPDAWKELFLKALAQYGVVRYACEKARVNRTAAYHARDADKAFSDAWDRAREEACDLLELEARRRAHDGLLRKKFTRTGEPIIDPATNEQYVEREYSDSLLMFLMRGYRPSVFSERIRQEATTLNVDMSQLSDEQLERIAKGEDVRSVLVSEGKGGAGAAAAAGEPVGAQPVAEPVSE